MRMINDCLDITQAKINELKAYDHDMHNSERKAMIEWRKELRGEFGNRKQRRIEQSKQRKGERV